MDAFVYADSRDKPVPQYIHQHFFKYLLMNNVFNILIHLKIIISVKEQTIISKIVFSLRKYN